MKKYLILLLFLTSCAISEDVKPDSSLYSYFLLAEQCNPELKQEFLDYFYLQCAYGMSDGCDTIEFKKKYNNSIRSELICYEQIGKACEQAILKVESDLKERCNNEK